MGLPPAPYIAASGLPVAGDQASAVLSGTIAAVGPTQPFAFRGPMNLSVWALINTALTTTLGSLTATVASGTGLAAGVAVNSTLVPPGTTYGNFAGTSGGLKLPALTLPGRTSTASNVISGLPVTAGLVGATVTGPGIPSGTTVVSIGTAAVAPTSQPPFAGVPGSVALSATPTSARNDNQPQQFTFALTGNGIAASGTDANATFTGAAVTFTASINIEKSFDGGATWLLANFGSGTLAQITAGTPVAITFGEPEKNVLYRLNCTAYTSGTINYRISQTGGAAESLAIGPLSNG